MSSLSIKSHKRSITSCTCFMHFPCLRKGVTVSLHNWNLQFTVCFQRTDVRWATYALVAEAHGAGFAFAEEKKTAIVQEERSAGAICSPAAHFTGVFRLCKEIHRYVDIHGKKKKEIHETSQFIPLQAQDRRFCVASQKGMHSPLRQRPLSTQVVLSSAWGGGGQWLLLPSMEEEEMSVGNDQCSDWV